MLFFAQWLNSSRYSVLQSEGNLNWKTVEGVKTTVHQVLTDTTAVMLKGPWKESLKSNFSSSNSTSTVVVHCLVLSNWFSLGWISGIVCDIIIIYIYLVASLDFFLSAQGVSFGCRQITLQITLGTPKWFRIIKKKKYMYIYIYISFNTVINVKECRSRISSLVPTPPDFHWDPVAFHLV